MRARILVLIWLWLLFPALVFVAFTLLDFSTDPAFFSLWVGTAWIVYYSGQCWRDRSRVHALLDEAELPVVVVFPARCPGTNALWRTVRGCFVVLTGRRVLVFTYNRFLDTPTGVLWTADPRNSCAELRSDERRLTVNSQGQSMEFHVAARRRKETALFVSALDSEREL